MCSPNAYLVSVLTRFVAAKEVRAVPQHLGWIGQMEEKKKKSA